MNVPQEARKEKVLAKLRAFNNYADCDVVQEAIDEIEKSDNQVDLIAAIAYSISAVKYRGGNKEAEELQALSNEIGSYGSLLQAIENKDSLAIAYFDNEMSKKNNPVRII